MRLSSLAKLQKNAKVPPKPDVEVITFPESIGGWNARDSVYDMPPNDAVLLINMFPTLTDVRRRGGLNPYATGMESIIYALMVYNPPGASSASKLFATTATKIYDISGTPTSTVTPSAVVTGLTYGRWQHVNFTTSGGSYLVLANGTDSVYEYDGTSWVAITGVSTPAITGITTSSLINVFAFKKRLFFVEKNKLKVWSLAVDSISGAATGFDLSSQFKKGGYIVTGGALTRDGGDGMDDLFVVISNNGEAVIYQGTDPSTDFVLVGRYDIAPPLGYKSMMKYGSDLLVMTAVGVVELGKVMSLDVSKQEYFALTDKIRNAFTQSTYAYLSGFYLNPTYDSVSYVFSSCYYPAGRMLMFMMPTSGDLFVQNADTGAWCRFRDMKVESAVVYKDVLLFGSNGVSNGGTVFTYSEAQSTDYNDVAIRTWYVPAFKKLRQKSQPIAIKFNWTTYPDLYFGSQVLTSFNINAGLAALGSSEAYLYPFRYSDGVFAGTQGLLNPIYQTVDPSYTTVAGVINEPLKLAVWHPASCADANAGQSMDSLLSVLLTTSQSLGSGNGVVRRLFIQSVDVACVPGAPP